MPFLSPNLTLFAPVNSPDSTLFIVSYYARHVCCSTTQHKNYFLNFQETHGQKVRTKKRFLFSFTECLQFATVSSIFHFVGIGAISCDTRLISSTTVLWHYVLYGGFLFYFDANCGKYISGGYTRGKYRVSNSRARGGRRADDDGSSSSNSN